MASLYHKWGRKTNQLFFSKKDMYRQGNLRHLLVNQVYTFSLAMPRRETNWGMGRIIQKFPDCSSSTISTNTSLVISICALIQDLLQGRDPSATGFPSRTTSGWHGAPKQMGTEPSCQENSMCIVSVVQWVAYHSRIPAEFGSYSSMPGKKCGYSNSLHLFIFLA